MPVLRVTPTTALELGKCGVGWLPSVVSGVDVWCILSGFEGSDGLCHEMYVMRCGELRWT